MANEQVLRFQILKYLIHLFYPLFLSDKFQQYTVEIIEILEYIMNSFLQRNAL